MVTRYTLFANSATTTTTTGFNTTSNASVTGVPGTSIAAAQLVYTLAGDFTGISNVAGTAITGSDALGDQTDGTVGQFTIDRDSGMAWGSNTNPLAHGSTLTNSITMTVDGTTAQTERSFTLAAKILGDANYVEHTAIATTTINTITTNGTLFTTNVFGPFNDIKITDTSGTATSSGGEIIITARNKSGDVISQVAGAAPLSAAVGNYETVVISGTDLLENYPNAIWLDFSVNTSSAAVSNIKKTSTGTSITVYANGKAGAL